jgi:multidrug efflux pump subunit AcrA (membrane-fusion protein)
VPETTTVEVTRRSFSADVELGGGVTASAENYAEVACAGCPPVAEVLVEPGASVQAGDPLVRVAGGFPQDNIDELAAALEEAREERETAEESLDEAVQRARNTLQQREEHLQQVQAALEDEEELSDEQIALLTVEVAATELAVERAEAAVRHDARIAQLEDELAAARAGGGVVLLRAPIDGQVTQVHADEGETAEGGPIPMVIVADTDELYVEAAATEGQGRLVEPGLEATVDLSTRTADPFEGTVAWVSPPLEDDEVALELPEDGGHMVRVDFENTGGVARPNDPVNVIVNLGEVENALTVPSPAVEWEDGIPWVHVGVAGEFERRAIVTGIANAEWTEVVDGLSEGDTVALPEGISAVREAERDTQPVE